MSNLAAAAAAFRNKPNQTIPEPFITPSGAVQYHQSPNLKVELYRQNMTQIQTDMKLERNRLGWTQRDLAKKAKVSQGTITRAERHGWVSIWTMLRIINALGKKLKLT